VETMHFTRREFLQASSALAVALGLRLPAAQAAEAGEAPTVVWLQGQGCSGCSMSLLNYINALGTIDKVLTNNLTLAYHPTLMAASGSTAKAAAEAARQAGGYFLVVEGAIPQSDDGKYCYIWPGTTVLDGVKQYAKDAKFILGVGTCGAFGGIAAAKPNPTGAAGLMAVLGGDYTDRIYNVSGCPVHPDRIVGTLAALIAGNPPTVDANRRPRTYYGRRLHECQFGGTPMCLERAGCKGPRTYCDSGRRKWNAASTKDQSGVNWCLEAGSPCLGCTEAGFPDAMMPFNSSARGRGGRGGGN
jgi:hydrogenase small subunit